MIPQFLIDLGAPYEIPIDEAKRRGWIDISRHPTAIVSIGDTFASDHLKCIDGSVWYAPNHLLMGSPVSELVDNFGRHAAIMRHKDSPSWRPGEDKSGGGLVMNPYHSKPLPLP